MTLRAATALWIATAIACSAAVAGGFSVPPLAGHVVDTSGQLAAPDVRALDHSLEAFRARTGFAIVVFVTGSLAGAPIEDVAYQAFNTWQVGDQGKDNGVLVVIAPVERQVRIETGKGVGGALTDLQANDIIRTQMGPLLAQGRLRPAIEAGVAAIAAALARDAPVVRPVHAPPSAPGSTWLVFVLLGGVGVIAVGAIVSPRFRRLLVPLFRVLYGLLQILTMFSGGKRGGGGSGGSGYRGGGGRSGGGGSSDRY